MEEKINVEKFKVNPKGPWLMLVSEIPPAKSASGKLHLQSRDFDEALRRGRVVAVGDEVKKYKEGDRVLHLCTGAIGIEMISKEIIGDQSPLKVLIKECDILASLTDAEDGDPVGLNTICQTLKAKEFTQIRDRKVSDKEKKENGGVGGLVIPANQIPLRRN